MTGCFTFSSVRLCRVKGRSIHKGRCRSRVPVDFGITRPFQAEQVMVKPMETMRCRDPHWGRVAASFSTEAFHCWWRALSLAAISGSSAMRFLVSPMSLARL